MIIPSITGIWSSEVWTPEKLSNLQLWCRGSELVVPTAGSFVWGDKSGNENDLLQTSASGFTPDVVSEGLNGEDVINFQAGDRLSATIETLDDPTIFLVFRCNTSANADPFSIAGNVLQFDQFAAANRVRFVGSTTSGFHSNEISLLSYHLARYDLKGGVNTEIQDNDTAVGTVSFTPNTTTAFVLGKGSSNSLLDVAEVVIMNGSPTAGEIEKMQNYVSVRYDIEM
jgi:hypothetical protein